MGISSGSLSHAADCRGGHNEGLLDRRRGRCKASLCVECSTPSSMRNPAGRGNLLSLRHGPLWTIQGREQKHCHRSSALPSVRAGICIPQVLGSAGLYCNRSYKEH